MDPTTFIFFVFIAICLIALWRQLAVHSSRIASLSSQMERFISDVESEKGTRRRANRDLANRVRILEGQQPLPHNDDTED